MGPVATKPYRTAGCNGHAKEVGRITEGGGNWLLLHLPRGRINHPDPTAVQLGKPDPPLRVGGERVHLRFGSLQGIEGHLATAGIQPPDRPAAKVAEPELPIR